MMNVLQILKNIFLGVFTIGCKKEHGVTSNRITVFSNAMMVFGIIISFAIYGPLDQYGVPKKLTYIIPALASVAPLVGIFNYFGHLFWARVFGLFLLTASGWNAVILYGKSFNGHYVFFVAIIYSILAFSKSSIYTRALLILIPYVNLPIADVLSHNRTLPLTGFSSFNFPVWVLLTDTFMLPLFIIIMVGIEKFMADRYENQLEVALDVIKREKQKIQVIYDSVDLGILMVDSNLKIEPEYSARVPKIFSSNDIAGRNLIEFIFSKSQLGAEEQSMMKSSLMSILGEDSLNWDLNCDHLVKQVEVKIEDRITYLSLSWSPIIHKDTVIAIVVGIKDMTDEILAQRKLAHDELMQTRAQEILSSIIKVGLRQTSQFIKDLGALSQKLKNNFPIKELLQDLHTIKGESRLLGLTELATLTHNLESELSENPNERLQMGTKQLTTYIDQLEEATALMFNKMQSDETWSLFSYMGHLRSKIERQLSENKSAIKVASLCLDDAVGDWPASLEKPLQTILVHAFQNSVDHGYIIPNKNEDIKINLSVNKDPKHYTISVEDFGHGIDMKKVESKWKNLDPKLKAIAPQPIDLLFLEQQSTAEKITQTSGRGVGLSAIKSTVSKLNGSLKIENKPENFSGVVLTVQIPRTSISQ